MANERCEKYRIKGRKIIKRTILSLIAFFLITGCTPSEQQNAASPKVDSADTFFSLVVVNRFPSGLTAETARGQELYLQKCAVCHGKSGDGKGFNAYNLKTNFGVVPFNFKAASANVLLPPLKEIKKAVSDGGPAVKKSQYMPPWGSTFIPYDIDCIAGYVWGALMGQKAKEMDG